MNPVMFGQSKSWHGAFRFAVMLPALVFGATIVLGAATAAAQTEDSQSDRGAESDRGAVAAQDDEASKKAETQETAKGWTPLKSAWKASQFGGDGPVEIEDNLIKFGFGDPMTGVRWGGDVARENYEIELEARRTDGFDFFCGLTFPVGKDHVSFIVGGWGGGVVGISSVDGHDASENDTTQFRNFDNEKWYKVRARVDPYRITCWIDDQQSCSQLREGHTFGIRYEMEVCEPLGFASYACKAEYRGIRVRKLTEKELADAKQAYEEDGQ